MRPQPESSTREVLAGLVERVTFHNSENGFCVLRAKVRGHRDVVTVVGHAATIAAGEWITASGEWVNDRTHGQTSSRPHRTGCARLTASGRFAPPAFSRPGPNRSGTGNHGFPAQPRCRHGAGGTDFQDLWRRRHPGHDGEPISSAVKIIRSIATCWWWTRPRWSMSC